MEVRGFEKYIYGRLWEVVGDVIFWGGLGGEGVCCAGTVDEILSLTILRCAVGGGVAFTDCSGMGPVL